jgi:glycosyltransferase involved in cell wall biosynthesis
VDVCICTFRRPAGLGVCLEALGAQELSADERLRPDVRVVVVDNDQAGDAAAVCAQAELPVGWRIDCVSEPERGITHARARAVAEARSDADWIAFLDDDERPGPCWLSSLLATQRETGARIVAGPVVPDLPPEVPAWLTRGRFFDRQRHPTGTVVDMTGTGNVLLHARMLRALPEPFDHRFALTGGEDTHLFMRLQQRGERIVWCDEAVVTETVPASRATAGWLVRRSWRGGVMYVVCERAVSPGVGTAVNRFARGCFRIVRGLVRLPAIVAGRRITAWHGVLLLVNGIAVLAGLANVRYREYSRPHGV